MNVLNPRECHVAKTLLEATGGQVWMSCSKSPVFRPVSI